MPTSTIKGNIVQYRDDIVSSLRVLSDKLLSETPSDSFLVLKAIALLSDDCYDVQKKLAQHYYDIADWQGAIIYFEKYCLAVQKDFESMFYLANSYKNIGNYEQAIKIYQRSLEIKLYPEGLMNLCSVYFDLNDEKLQLHTLERLIREFPDFALGHYNFGIYWYGKKDLQRSIQCYRRALEINPEHGESRIALSLALLMDKQYTEGFEQYDSRWGVWANCPIRNFNRPYWHGQEVGEGRSILVTLEQGFGDTLMMLRYLPQLICKFVRVIIEVQPSMQRLVEKSFPKIEVVVHGNPLPDTDWFCPVMSLPRAFETGKNSIPRPDKYISIPGAEPFNQDLLIDSRKKIGICWRGSKVDSRMLHRSLTLDTLASMFEKRDFLWVPLTKDVDSDEIEIMSKFTSLKNWMNQVADFYDTYRLINDLDLIVTVDTAIAHLAGAMGKDTIVLLTEGYDWRWHLNDATAEWYTKTRLLKVHELPSDKNLGLKLNEMINQIVH